MTRSVALLLVASLAVLPIAAGCGDDDVRVPPGDAGFDGGATPGDAGRDGGLVCATGEMNCGGSCISVQADDANCGSCGNACPAGLGCAGGTCSCPAPRLVCGGVCVDPQNDATNCNTCGNTCPAGGACVLGMCVDACDPPREICINMIPGGGGGMGGGGTDAGVDGGVVDVDAGAADVDAGVDAGFTGDAGVITVPVCADLQTDPLNCGRCRTTCIGGGLCEMGRCRCPMGQQGCDGRCVDLNTDPDHCGACVLNCGTGGTCAGGVCTTCGDGRTPCGGRCVDTMTDPGACGMCGRACADGATCTAGVCACPGTEIPCGVGVGTCTATDIDEANCGMCGRTCAVGAMCLAGTCMCPGTEIPCGPGSGTCREVSDDPLNCGSCGRACAGMEACSGGLCVCTAPAVDCGDGCTDLMTDPDHCGTCPVTCGPGGVCTAGACTCVAGLTLCSGSCRNLMTDRANCGMCGMACPAGEFCIAGGCTIAPPIRYVQSSETPTTVPFIDACTAPGHIDFLASTDDNSMRTPLPFAFRYWATDLTMGTMINVCTNGWIGMAGGTDATISGTIPSTSTPNGVIAAHWGDNVTRGAICTATIGTAPNRQWVVEWPAAGYFGGAAGVSNTFEIILNEGSGIIDLVYGTMTMSRAQGMGLENQTGMMGINACPGGTGTCTPTTGQRVRFTPSP